MKRFFIVVGIFWFAQYIYVPFFSPYLVLLGVSASLVGIIAGSYGVTQMILRIPVSVAGSLRGNHKFIIGAGLAFVALSCVLPLLSGSWIVYLLMRMFSGVASATWVSYSAFLLETAGDRAGSRMGYLFSANAIGIVVSQVIGTVLYGQLGGTAGMHAIFLVTVFTSLGGLCLLLTTRFHASKEDAPRPAFSRSGFLAVLRNRHLWLCSSLLSVLFWIIFSSSYSFTAVYAQETLCAGALHLGLLSIVLQVVTAAVSLAIGRRKGTGHEKQIIVLGFVLTAIYCALTPFSELMPLICLQALGGTGYTLANVYLFANAGRELAASQQLLAMGLLQTVYSVGMTAGPAVSGFVLERSGGNYPLFFLILAAIAAVAAVWTALRYRDASAAPTDINSEEP